MNNLALKVENLSKRYRIGLKEEKYKTFSGAVSNFLKSPFKNYRKIQSLKKFNADAEDVIWALNDVNFEVKKGEAVGIIGRNGAGKSTLLKILSRITEPSSGRITVYGRVASLLEVGTGFNPELTGRENIYLNGTILGMSRREIDRKRDEIIDFSGVEKFIDTPVKRYSSGMYVRLAFAVAAHLEPDILVIDEVLAVGDAAFQKKCLGRMQEVSKKEGGTVLFVSHNMQFVQNLCTRGLLMQSGTMTYDGGISEVVNKYFSDNTSPDSNNPSSHNGFSIHNFKLADAEGNETEVVRTGRSYSIHLELEGCVEDDFPVLQLRVMGIYGEIIVNLSSRLAGLAITNFKNTLKCKIDLESMMLMPGSYFLTVNLYGSQGNLITSWENTKKIEVILDAGMINVFLPEQQYRGFVYVPSKWAITSA